MFACVLVNIFNSYIPPPPPPHTHALKVVFPLSFTITVLQMSEFERLSYEEVLQLVDNKTVLGKRGNHLVINTPGPN